MERLHDQQEYTADLDKHAARSNKNETIRNEITGIWLWPLMDGQMDSK